jgi:hypothetical protein
MEDKNDLFIETIQRNKFMVYLLENATRSQLKPPKIVEALKLNLGQDKKKKKNVVDFKNEENNKTKVKLQRNFICLASVYGFLSSHVAKQTEKTAAKKGLLGALGGKLKNRVEKNIVWQE